MAECLHELLEAQARERPKAVALRSKGRDLHWAELDRSANRLARWLMARGARPGTRVGIFLDRSIGTVVSILAVLKSGAAYVPLDPLNPDERLEGIIEDSNISLLITTLALDSRLRHRQLTVLHLYADAAQLAAEDSEPPAGGAKSSDLAYVIYTSGTTGKPKGVQITHGSVVHLLEATRPMFDFNPDDTWTLFHSVAFDFSVWEIFGCLSAGGKLVIVPSSATRSPAELHELLLREQVTVLNLTPATIRALDHFRKRSAPEPGGTLSLRLMICGGEALPTALARDLLEWQTPLWNFYGPTEATVWATCGQVRSPLPDGSLAPIGRPLPGYEVHLLNERLERVADDAPGEIHIGGPGLARGYWNRPERTAAKFIPNPFTDEPSSRLFKTGDLARYLPDGALEFLGRLDSQVKIRGFRVELEEIEAVAQQHPAVAQCAVSFEQERLVAFVAPRAGTTVEPGAIRQFLLAKLPDYMVPAQFVTIGALPLNSNGKVDRRALRTGEIAPEPPGPSRDPNVAELVRIFGETLNWSGMDADDNFFELGGDSLKAARLGVEVERSFGRKIDLNLLYQAPTPASFAKAMREAPLEPARLVLIQKGASDVPLFYMHVGAGNLASQHSLMRHLGAEFSCYGLLAPGIATPAAPGMTVEDVAAENLAAIRTAQPHGPYLLAGISSGGIVAFEMAQQLRRQGEDVALLAFLDASAAPDDYRPFRDHLRVYFNLPVRERIAFAAREFARVARKFCSPGTSAPASLEAVRVAELGNRLHRAYVPEPYPGKAILFRARESLSCFADGGWGTLITGGLEIHEIPGAHSPLGEPALRSLAEYLRPHLSGAMKSRRINGSQSSQSMAMERT